MAFLRNLWNDEQGQDLIEYTLLMAFVALVLGGPFHWRRWAAVQGHLVHDQQPTVSGKHRPRANPCRGSGAFAYRRWRHSHQNLIVRKYRTPNRVGPISVFRHPRFSFF